MIETVPQNLPSEEDLDLSQDIEALRNTQEYIRSTLGPVGFELPSDVASEAVIDKNCASITSRDRLSSFVQTTLFYTAVGVELSTDHTGIDETILRRKIGLMDNDSFAFIWGVMDRLSPVQAAEQPIEQKTIGFIATLRKFITDPNNFQAVQEDPRLQGPLHLYAAVELSANRDYEAALSEIEQIPEESLRNFYKNALSSTLEQEAVTITPEQSRQNLEQQVGWMEPPVEIPDAKETKIASNHSLETFISFFDPLAAGRIYASGENRGANLPEVRGPSSGDLDGRRIPSETMLGHPRRLFAARVVYGSLLPSDELAKTDDLGWAFGKARFILKNDSRTAQEASFTWGDSLNGTVLRENRVLLRPEADIASTIYSEVFSTRQRRTYGTGNTEQYIEAQFDGLSIPDIEEIILRPGAVEPEQNDSLSSIAETAAMHGIKVDYVFNWRELTDNAKNRYRDFDTASAAQGFLERLKQLKGEYPHVNYVLEIDEEDKGLFQALDQSVTQITF